MTLPVVDFRLLSGSPGDQVAFDQSFGDALRSHGFGVVAEHPIDRPRIEQAFALSAALFALPDAEKRNFVVPGSQGNRGYVPFGGERALGASVADLKEFWHIGQNQPPAGSPLLPNVWPDHDPAFRAGMTALYRDLEETARALLRSIARYLGQPPDHLASMTEGGDSILRLLHYPPIPEGAPAGAIRAAAHEDINLITLLAEGSSGGLELLTRQNTWMPVQSLRGHLVINAGDMLQLVTHGRLRSTTHRVVNPTGPNVSRISIPFFTHPRPDVLLDPMPPEAGYQGPPRSAITAGAFLRERLAAIAAPA